MIQFQPDDWTAAYNALVDSVVPGLNEIIVHLAYNDAEMQAIMMDHPAFGAEWRQNDLDYVLSDSFKSRLKENDIHLVSYKQIKEAISRSKN